MGKIRYLALGTLAAVASVGFANLAQASGFAGEFFKNDIMLPTEADVTSAGSATGTFNVGNTLAFNSLGATDYTIKSWLGTGGVTYSGADATGTMDNTLWDFKGTAYVKTGQTFTITHDDGLSLYINGIDVFAASVDLPTPSITSTGTWTGASGTYSAELVYSEGYGPPAILGGTITTIPEPSTWAMMVLGFAGLGYAGFRSRKTAITIA